VLYNGTYLNRTYSERALELLSKTRFTDGLAAGIPAGIPLSHKFGVSAQPTGEKQLHDCGIIYDTQTKTYVLCVMTTGDDYRQMADVIRDVATAVHNAMQHRE
jgi:beta-lactamase class A